MSIVFGYYSAPPRAAGQGKWNFFRGVGVCFGLPLPDFLAFFVDALVVVVVLGGGGADIARRLSYTHTPLPLSYTSPLRSLASYMNINYIVYNSYLVYILSKP